jgi:hypothetical protein
MGCTLRETILLNHIQWIRLSKCQRNRNLVLKEYPNKSYKQTRGQLTLTRLLSQLSIRISQELSESIASIVNLFAASCGSRTSKTSKNKRAYVSIAITISLNSKQ